VSRNLAACLNFRQIEKAGELGSAENGLVEMVEQTQNARKRQTGVKFAASGSRATLLMSTRIQP